jgi:hypothetical protein
MAEVVITKDILDPTVNVIAMLKAAEERQDELLEGHKNFNDAQIQYLKDMADLRSEHSTTVHRLESERLKAVRDVDVASVKTEADRAQAAIEALAKITTSNAETLRAALNNTATTIATQTSETINRIVERIAALEKSSYEGAGKQAVADPMMTELISEVKALRSSQEMSSGKEQGVSSVWLWVFGGIGAIGTIFGILGSIALVVSLFYKAHGG